MSGANLKKGAGLSRETGCGGQKRPSGGLQYVCRFSLVGGRHFWYCVLPAFCWVGHMLSGCKVYLQSRWVYHWSWRSVYHSVAHLPHPDTTPFLPHLRTTDLHLGSLPSTICFSTRSRPLPIPSYTLTPDIFETKFFPYKYSSNLIPVILQIVRVSYSPFRVKLSVTEPSDAVKRRNGWQTQRLWLGLVPVILPTFTTYEDGTDRVFRNVGI